MRRRDGGSLAEVTPFGWGAGAATGAAIRLPPNERRVIYFFSKAHNYVRCELYPGRPHVLVVCGPGDAEHTERFSSAAALDDRWNEVRTQMAEDGWSGPFGRDGRA